MKKIFYYCVASFFATPVAFLLHYWSHLFVFKYINGTQFLMHQKYFEVQPYNWAIDAVNKLILAGIEIKNVDGGMFGMVDSTNPSKLIIFGILLGPIIIHLVGFLGLYLYKVSSFHLYWALGFGAQIRTILLICTGVFRGDGYIDEIEAAKHLGLPYLSLYWISIILGVSCLLWLVFSLKKEYRYKVAIFSFFSGLIALEIFYKIYCVFFQ